VASSAWYRAADDSVIGLLALIGVVAGTILAGEPREHPAIATTEGWILGRSI
jgi:hypothetical protein